MIIDLFGSLKENLTKKVRNPFFGTLSVVFVLKNWQLFYSLLFFDSADTRTTRIEILEKYIDDSGGTLWMFGFAVLCTFGVLIMSYLLQGTAAYISNTYDSRTHPWIIKWATKGAKTVTKEDYTVLERRCKQLEDKGKEEHTKRIEAEAELEKAEKSLQVHRNKQAEDAQQADKEYEDYLNTKEERLNQTSDNDSDIDVSTTTEKTKSRAEKIADKIYATENWGSGFTLVLSQINQGYLSLSVRSSTLLDFLYSQGIIKKDGNHFFLSEFGEKVSDYFLAKTL